MQALEAAVALRELVLSCNALEGLRGLGALTGLTRLDASYNRLSSLAGLMVCQACKEGVFWDALIVQQRYRLEAGARA